MPRILFLTSPEMGQSNCIAATLHGIRELYPDDERFDLHFASFAPVNRAVPEGVTTHIIPGNGIKTHIVRQLDAPGADRRKVLGLCLHHAGFISNLLFNFRQINILHPGTPSEYVKAYHELVRLIEDLKPDLCVLEPLWDEAADAVAHTKSRSVVIHPMDAKIPALGAQEWGILKIPQIGTGFNYPMSLWQQFLTFVGLFTATIWLFFLDPKIRALNKARQQAGLKGPLPVFAGAQGKVLCMQSDHKLDYPIVKVPDNIIPCGPILLPSQPVSVVDPELLDWLKKGPVILIVLGSNLFSDQNEVDVIKRSLRVILAHRKDVRVLWKVQKLGEYALNTDDMTHRSDGSDRVKIVDWLEADPIAILQTGNVAVFVNHGGSNCYHESLATGTPQIILSPWADCHDNGALCEWLGVGAWGNRRASPHYQEEELTAAFTKVVGVSPTSEPAAAIRNRALECKILIDMFLKTKAAGRMRPNGSRMEGRHFAAMEVLALVKGQVEERVNGRR